MFKNIPKHWNINPLSFPEISTIIMGQSPSSNTYNDTQEGLPFFQGKADFGDFSPTPRVWCSKPLKISQKDDILLSVRAPVGAINYNTETCCIGRGLAAIRAGKKLLPKYIYYFFKYYEPILKEEGSGAVFSAITKSFVENIRIPVPPTLEEQQEIVDVLDAASEIIRLRTACIESAQSLIPALFQEMFDISQYPLLKLDEICEVKGGKRLPKGCNLQEEKTEHPYIRVTNFKNNNIDIKDLKYISNDVFEQIKRYTISCNDIYMSIAGTIGLVGEIPNELDNANLTENAAKLILKNNSFNKKFLIHCLSSGFLQKQISEATVGVGVPKLALIRILNLKLPNVPTEQQELFAEKVQEIEAYIKTQQAELENAKTMFQSLLHHSFTGELTRHKFGGDANG